LVSLHFCTSDAWGGLEIYASTLMAELQRSGCDVIAVCKPNSKIEEFLRAHNVECCHLPNYSKFSFSSLKFINNLLRERNVEVVHVHFHKDIWLPSMALRNDPRRKLFQSIYMGIFSKNDLLHRWVYRRVNAIFTSSHRHNAVLSERLPVPKEKFHYLPYGRQLDRYDADAVKRNVLRKRYNIHDNELLIGTMVRIDPGKGALDFARSFSYLDAAQRSNVKYIIFGEPTRKGQRKADESPYEPHCEAYMQEIQSFIEQEHLTGNIILAGHQDDVAGNLSAMDIFVFPSRDELYSLVMLDAMAMGLPIIATRAGGNLEQITDGTNGVHFEVGNSEDLAKKISQYIDHPEQRKQHGAAARSFVEQHHDMRNTIRQLLNYYNTTT
jgi:glycosyltransferase involved in cell wall biosynthesis